MNKSGKCQVLVVEDNFINSELMKEMLDRLDCEVDLAENGFAALNKMKSNTYDLIFMDLHMPEMDGFETTRIIRTGEEGSTTPVPVPVIATTANVTPGIVDACMEAGMNAYLPKPFLLSELEGLLDKYFDR